MAGLWGAVALIAWRWQLLSAFLLALLAAYGILLAVVVFLVSSFENPHGRSQFWLFFAWWVVITLVSALLSVGVHRLRTGHSSIW
jgi:hypothetical protein